MTNQDIVLWLENVGMADVPRVGRKNASLGEMIQHLTADGVRVRPGFATTAEAYRDNYGFDHLKVALSVGVQKMVRADLGGAGVMFSLDTETGFPNVVLITAAWGLGETVVQGEVDPDQYMVFKPLLDRADLVPIVQKARGAKIVIAPHPRRAKPLPLGAQMYKRHHLSENFFCKLKELKRIAMRADKTDHSFAASIQLATAVINSR
jgi:phosphoenolpyruvate synthase/pyruvate phosphate dikinase